MINILSILYILINQTYSDQIGYDSMDTGIGWRGSGTLTSSISTAHCDSPACVHLSNNGTIEYHDISTVNYHNIQIQYSISVLDFEDAFDKCQVFYSIDTINWVRLAKYNYTHNGNKYVEIKNMNKDADNIQTLAIRFQSDTSFDDYCYIDEIYIFGQYGTRSPTIEPTITPTLEPTYEPTIEPSNIPTVNPSIKLEAVSSTISPTDIKHTIIIGHGQVEEATTTLDMDETEQNINDNAGDSIQSDSFLSSKYLLYQIILGIMISLCLIILCLLCIIIKYCLKKKKHNHNKNIITIKVDNSYNDKERIMSPKVIHIRHSTDNENIEIVSDPSVQIPNPSPTNTYMTPYINRNPFDDSNSNNKSGQLMIDTRINVISIMTTTSEGTSGEMDMHLYDITPPHNEDEDDDAMYDNITSEEDGSGNTKGNTMGGDTPDGDDDVITDGRDSGNTDDINGNGMNDIYDDYEEDNDTPVEGSHGVCVNVNDDHGDVTPQ